MASSSCWLSSHTWRSPSRSSCRSALRSVWVACLLNHLGCSAESSGGVLQSGTRCLALAKASTARRRLVLVALCRRGGLPVKAFSAVRAGAISNGSTMSAMGSAVCSVVAQLPRYPTPRAAWLQAPQQRVIPGRNVQLGDRSELRGGELRLMPAPSWPGLAVR